MARYITHGGQYFTFQNDPKQGTYLTKVNPNDIIGDAGTKSGGGSFTLAELMQPNALSGKGPFITPLDTSKLKIINVIDPKNPNFGKTAVDFGGQAVSNQEAWVNQDIANLLQLKDV